MIDFQYARANDVADAVRQMAADPTAKFIAGGTNLIDLMKEDVERPSRLIDISRLPLKAIEETADGGLRIGALVPNSDLAYHPLIEQRYPMLASAILAGGDQGLSSLELKGAVFALMRRLTAEGAHVHIPRHDQEYAVDVGLRMLLLRHLVVDEAGVYRPHAGDAPLLAFYANAIAHLLPAEADAVGRN